MKEENTERRKEPTKKKIFDLQERCIHKLQIALKELRETEVWLKIILRVEIILPSKLSSILTETDELIAILLKSIQTAKKNKER